MLKNILLMGVLSKKIPLMGVRGKNDTLNGSDRVKKIPLAGVMVKRTPLMGVCESEKRYPYRSHIHIPYFVLGTPPDVRYILITGTPCLIYQPLT